MSEQMREEFENWVKSNWPNQSLDRFNPLHGVTDGDYMGFTVQHCWEAWKACRESQPPGYTAVDMATAAADGFRDGAASKEKIIDALLNHCEDGECHVCSQIICPYGDGMHFHHDGCPSCAQEPT